MNHENQNDHDLLIRVDTKLEVLLKEFSSFTKTTTVDMADMKVRVSKLENWRWYILGFSAAIALAIEFYFRIKQ